MSRSSTTERRAGCRWSTTEHLWWARLREKMPPPSSALTPTNSPPSPTAPDHPPWSKSTLKVRALTRSFQDLSVNVDIYNVKLIIIHLLVSIFNRGPKVSFTLYRIKSKQAFEKVRSINTYWQSEESVIWVTYYCFFLPCVVLKTQRSNQPHWAESSGPAVSWLITVQGAVMRWMLIL